MAKEFKDFQAQLDSNIQDGAKRLTGDDRDTALRKAITQRYSKDRPIEVVTDVSGNGSHDIDVPAPQSGPAFEDGFSLVRLLEYPIGNVPETYVPDFNWKMYRAPSGLKIRLVEAIPTNAESVRVAWTARHKEDGSTVPDQDFEAVCDFAAALCFEALAATYVQTGDPSVNVDVVNYRSKSQEYLNLAKAARRRYYDFMGIEEGSAGAGAAAGPGIAIGDLDEMMGSGIDRITHSRYTR